MRLLLDALKMLLLAAVGYSAVHGRIIQIVTVQQLSFVTGLSPRFADVVYSIGLRIGLMLLILALIDYAYQRYRIEQELKMSKQEVKEEMRRMEGDPKIKLRRRQLALQAAAAAKTQEGCSRPPTWSSPIRPSLPSLSNTIRKTMNSPQGDRQGAAI
jgi:flagellar biosynthesis protein FlhB